jgi:hypothetical protein
MQRKTPRNLAAVLLCLAALAGPTMAQTPTTAAIPPLDPGKLSIIDTDPVVAKQIGEDRLLKYVIASANEGDSSIVINRQYLDRSIAETLQDDSAMTLMAQDINHGDTRLRTALTGVFQTFNYNPAQIEDIFRRWAAGQKPEVARAVLNNTANEANAMRFLSGYILTTPNNWARVLDNAVQVEGNKMPLTPAMLEAALVNSDLLSRDEAAKMVQAAGSGDIDERASVADLIIKLDAYRGTVSRYLEGENTAAPPASWLGHVYDSMIRQIAQDPLYLTDYVKRSTSATVLYNTWGHVMAEALTSNDKGFFDGYYTASRVPNSRFSLMIDNLLGQGELRQQLGTDPQQVSGVVRTKALATMQSDPKVMADFMWQLTRPAEVLCLTIRNSLPSVLSNDPALAKEFAQELPRIGGPFNAELRATTAFSYYGDPAEFRRRMESGKLTIEGLQQFGQQAGLLLASSDTAWKSFFSGNGGNDNLTRLLVLAAIAGDRDTAICLIRTIEGNDTELYSGFGNWLIANNHTQDVNAYSRWLDSVVRTLEANSAVGNTDVADFKAWVAGYLKTPEGWTSFSHHLAGESTSINEPLRESMAVYLSNNPDELWNLLGLIGATHGETTITVRQKLQNYVIAGHVNEILLRQVAAQNQVAADAAYPVWGELLRKGSPTIKSIENTVDDGAVLNDLAAVVIQSLVNIMNRPDYEQIMDGPMRQLTGLDASVPPEQVEQKTQQMLTYDAAKCTDFFKAAFGNPQVEEAWRIDFLNQIRLNGKAYVVADHLKRNPDLQTEWAQLVAQATTQDVTLWKQILLSLVYRQVTTDFNSEGPTSTYYDVARIMVGDRVMFEQMLSNPGADYRADYAKEINLQIGSMGAEVWMGEKSQ